MKRLVTILAALLVVLLNSTSEAQTGYSSGDSSSFPHTATVSWTRYASSSAGVSILLPKLPIVSADEDSCEQSRIVSFTAYAEGVAYELTSVSKSDAPVPSDCPKTARFGRSMFASQLRDWRTSLKVRESNITLAGRKAFVFRASTSTRWLIDDLSNGRWIEVAAYYYVGSKVDLSRFSRSLVLSAENGTEINDGNPWILGDDGVVSPTSLPAKQEPPKPSSGGMGSGYGPGKNTLLDLGSGSPPPLDETRRKVDKVMVVVKPGAEYTEAARSASVQGVVRLRVALLANGSVGKITPITGLPYGLTEEAVAAAKRTVFLPKRLDGIPVDSAKVFEYSFGIY